VKEQSDIKERLSAIEQSVNDGWIIIRKTDEKVSSLEKTVAQTQERTEGIFKILKDLTNTIKSIDTKLDEYIKDVRTEIKETNDKVVDIAKDLALNTYKTNAIREFMKGYTFPKMAGTALIIISIMAGLKSFWG